MGRQILAIIVGIAVSFLAAAASGYFLYQLAGHGSRGLPSLARYAFQPAIALIVGAFVGALAKYRPGTLAALSLVPGELVFIFFQRQDARHLLVLLLLGILYLLIGVTSAIGVFRIRRSNLSRVDSSGIS
jgi:hypothetical protein